MATDGQASAISEMPNVVPIPLAMLTRPPTRDGALNLRCMAGNVIVAMLASN
jgi:hypothetical protein